MKIRITTDSTSDLSAELLQKYNVDVNPLHVSLDGVDYHDGVNICQEDIYTYYNEHKKLPKSGACSIVEFEEFFQKQKDLGYDAVIHFTISAEMSSSYNNAVSAAEKFQNVFVVDSRNLTTGTGLLVLDACDMVAQGKTPEQIVERAKSRVDSVHSSFIISTLEFLHKGGRCSSMVYYAANMLGLKPTIEVKSGKMGVGNKFIGKYHRCVRKYCEHVKHLCTSPDTKRCFVTHTHMDHDLDKYVVDIVKSWGIFDEVIETTAGCTVTTHCGANTIGILYINDGEELHKKS